MARDSETSEPNPSDVFPPTRLHCFSLPKSYQWETKCSNAWRSWRTVFIQTTAIIIYIIHWLAVLCFVRSIITFIYVYLCMFYLNAGVSRGQTGAFSSLGLELEVVVSCPMLVLGIWKLNSCPLQQHQMPLTVVLLLQSSWQHFNFLKKIAMKAS